MVAVVAALAMMAIPAGAVTGGVWTPAHESNVTGGISAAAKPHKCTRYVKNGKRHKCHKPVNHEPMWE
jgi:hypothetical protein